MLKKTLVIILITTTCKQEPVVIIDPYSNAYEINTACHVEEWYNLHGVEVYKCYR